MRSTSCWSIAASARIPVMAAQWYPGTRFTKAGVMNALLPREAAEVAGLCYVSGAGAGIRRMRAGKAFRYLGPDERAIARYSARLDRRMDLPARGCHLQAWGRDARRRK